MTKLRTDWHTKMHMYLGYRVVEDDGDLRAFNKCISDIVRSEKMKALSGWKETVEVLTDCILRPKEMREVIKRLKANVKKVKVTQ